MDQRREAHVNEQRAPTPFTSFSNETPSSTVKNQRGLRQNKRKMMFKTIVASRLSTKQVASGA